SECAKIIGEHLKGKGRVAVLVTSSLRALIMAQRQRSVVTYLADKYPGIEVVETFEAQANQDLAAEFVKRIAPHVDAIYITGNSTAAGAARGLEEAGMQGRVYLLCHDLDTNIAGFIKNGSISASLVCSTVGQGRDSVIHLFNHIVAGWKPIQPRLYIPLELVNQDNLSYFWDFSSDSLMELTVPSQNAVMPISPSLKTLRIVVLLEDWNSAFMQMKAGVMKAGEILKSFNAELILHTVNQLKRQRNEVVLELQRILEDESARGIDGIVAFVGSSEIIPILNRQHEKGIPITTFDSEPLGLRSMILWLTQSSIELGRFSSEYLIGHQEINQSMQEILNTLNNMVGRVGREADTAKDGARSVADLLSLIEKTVDREQQQMEKVSDSSHISTQLAEMVDFFNSKIEGLKIMDAEVAKSREKVSSMSDYSDKILSIISLIDDISQQTNLLALNAAIEAARAGEKGKGFEIIAREIRNLADRSTMSTHSIADLINDLRNAIEESISAIGKTKNIVDEQVKSITTASGQISRIAEKLSVTMQRVQETVN
ncbi:MAG: hypothetical protein EHM28_15345, partial [Spirochaetaceae bacterium]